MNNISLVNRNANYSLQWDYNKQDNRRHAANPTSSYTVGTFELLDLVGKTILITLQLNTETLQEENFTFPEGCKKKKRAVDCKKDSTEAVQLITPLTLNLLIH
jgi:hypothetical protein